MVMISAQVSLYPLRQPLIAPLIREAVRVFSQSGLETRIGEMSTLVWGEEQTVFAALQAVFRQATACSDAVMVVTLSNACPKPTQGNSGSPEEV
ncbi:MAG: thiamine-binding protein [Anaerolineae bacterium]|nr:thiamine-binding protein [Anaerolineae bacterium]